MNGLQSFAAGGVDLRGGHQVGSLEHRVDVLIGAASSSVAKRTAGEKRALAGGQQRPHVDSNQLLRLYPDEIGQGAIDSQHLSRLIVGDDEVRNGVEDFNPVAIGLLDAGQKARILK